MSVIDASRSGAMTEERDRPAGPVVLGHMTRADAVLASLLSIAVIGLFYRFLIKQLGPNGFSAQYFEDWGHAYFVPLVSGFYIWKNREKLARVRVKPYWPAVTLLPLAVVTYVYFIINFS